MVRTLLKRKVAAVALTAAAVTAGGALASGHVDAAPRNTLAVAACHAENGVVLYSNGSYHCRYALVSRETYCINVLIVYYHAYANEAYFLCDLVNNPVNSFN